MFNMTNSRLFLAILLALCVSYAFGHSYVTEPRTRTNQKETQSGCRGPNCLGPCDAPFSASRTPAVTIARGASITVKWPRNNHAGGFIRLAWTQTSGSDVHANFDNGVQEIVCHEIGGCFPDDSKNPNGGDSGPGDGSSRACSTSINVPLHLSDGEWTLQWAWFGGAFALGDYYSCVDYKISGGPTGAKVDAVFIGGDYTYPGQNKCKFFNTDRLHACVQEPCDKPVYTMYQEQSGPAFGFSSNQNKPLTTAAAKPITTAQVSKLLTTSQAPPATTGKAPAASTGRVSLTTGTKPATPSTTGKVVSAPNPSNCAGLTKEVTSTEFEITAVDTWSNVFRMEIKMDVNELVSDWMVQVIWPDDAFDTEVENAYNAGELRCSATVPTRHSMIEPAAKWANKIKAGEQMYIELRATNTNMNGAFLKSNTKLKMFKK
jgi:hypothetical protein